MLVVDPVGIVSVGVYSPKEFMTAGQIAEASGLPEWVVREKLGISRKFVGGPDDQPNAMGVKAALDCLAKASVPAEEIDVVLCTTEEWKEYLLWTAGVDLAYQIGARRAWAMDVHMRCATTIGAIKLASDMIRADPEVNTVLIAGGYRLADLINLRNPRTSFMFNIGAGGGAMLLRRGWPSNHVLGTHLICDGAMARHVLVPASGTMAFPTDEAVRQGLFQFDLLEPEAMKERLNTVSLDNWLTCVDEALRKSGRRPDGQPYRRADLSFLDVILIKPSAHRELLARLGLTEEQSVYLSDYGHTGEQDMMFGIVEGLRQARLKDGDLMAMMAAGIGYVWAAGIVRWGPAPAGA